MTSSPIQVAFPKVDEGSTALAIPTLQDAPAVQANQGLAAYAGNPSTRQTLSCRTLLLGQTMVKAQREAAEMYDKMRARGGDQVFMAYGTQALKGVNDLIERLLHEVEPARIPELTALMKDLNREMRGIKGKYDPSDPRVLRKYEAWRGGVGRFFGHAKTLVELLMEDVTSIESQINKVAKTLHGRQLILVRNVSYYGELYRENGEEILKLIYVIGVMELIRDLSTTEMQSITVGRTDLGDQGELQRRELAEFVSNLEVKIGEYKGRLIVAWTTSPNVLTMRSLNIGLAERINELLCVTIPTMKATIVQWRMLAETQEAAQMSRVVQEASNEWLQAYAHASAAAVPMIAEAVQTPTLTPVTIAAMAASIATQAEGIVKAMELGAQRRQEMDAAILQARTVIANAQAHVSDELIQHVVGTAMKPLEIATSVSEENASTN